MKTNFRKSYLSSLGFSDYTQLKRESSHLETLLQQEDIDVLKLRKITEKYEIPPKYRAHVWKILLGVVPEHKAALEYVEAQRKEQYNDLKTSSMTYFRKSIEPMISRAITLPFGGMQQKFSKQQSSTKPPTFSPGSSLRNSFSLDSGISALMNSWPSSLRNGEDISQFYNSVVFHVVLVYCAREFYIYGKNLEGEETILDLIKLAEIFHTVIEDESETFWCLSSFLGRPINLTQTFGKQRAVNELTTWLESTDIQLYRHIQIRKLSLEHITMRWFRNYFAGSFPIDATLRIWDKIIVLTCEFTIFIALSILQCFRTDILERTDTRSVIALTQDLSEVNVDTMLKKAVDYYEIWRQVGLTKPRRSSQPRRSNESNENHTITFSIHYNTQFGEVLCIAGSIPELGAWNTQNMVLLSWNEGNIWTTSIHVKKGVQHFEYKYNVYDTRSRRIVRWESLPSNRRMDVTSQSLEVRDNWDIQR